MLMPPRSRRARAAAAPIPNYTTPNSQRPPNSATPNSRRTRNSATPKTPKLRTRSLEVRLLFLGVPFLTLGVLGVGSWAFIGNWELRSCRFDARLRTRHRPRSGDSRRISAGAEVHHGRQAACAGEIAFSVRQSAIRHDRRAGGRRAQGAALGGGDRALREGGEAASEVRRGLLVSGDCVLFAR